MVAVHLVRGAASGIEFFASSPCDDGMYEDPMSQLKSADDARQGVTGHNVRYVLFWGIILAVFALGTAAYFAR
jgi:hypothetical protein